jgi:hypothetical protein
VKDYEPTSHSPSEGTPATTTVQERWPSTRRLSSKKTGVWVAAAGLTCAAAMLVGAGTSSAATPSSSASSLSATTTSSPTTTPPGGSGGGARSGPEEGGATGIVDSMSTSGFTMSTATGVEVTVDEVPSTIYLKGANSASVRAVNTGASVLVLGVVDSPTITAGKVIVQPGGDGGATAAKAAGVIPFQQGVPSPTKAVGQIPSDYIEGDGTIVSGPTADKATAAAQAVVPGGVADRVVKLSDGEYEVHNISVNWPHHVFVSSDFKILGYE